MTIRPIRSFTDMIATLNRGHFMERLDSELVRAIETLEALPEERGKATITVVTDIVYESGRIDIKPTVKVKLPEGKAFSGTPFWSYDGGLSVQHPSQVDMFSGPRPAYERERNAG